MWLAILLPRVVLLTLLTGVSRLVAEIELHQFDTMTCCGCERGDTSIGGCQFTGYCLVLKQKCPDWQALFQTEEAKAGEPEPLSSGSCDWGVK